MTSILITGDTTAGDIMCPVQGIILWLKWRVEWLIEQRLCMVWISLMFQILVSKLVVLFREGLELLEMWPECGSRSFVVICGRCSLILVSRFALHFRLPWCQQFSTSRSGHLDGPTPPSLPGWIELYLSYEPREMMSPLFFLSVIQVGCRDMKITNTKNYSWRRKPEGGSLRQDPCRVERQTLMPKERCGRLELWQNCKELCHTVPQPSRLPFYHHQ